jgi:hypothetical protein
MDQEPEFVAAAESAYAAQYQDWRVNASGSASTERVGQEALDYIRIILPDDKVVTAAWEQLHRVCGTRDEKALQVARDVQLKATAIVQANEGSARLRLIEGLGLGVEQIRIPTKTTEAVYLNLLNTAMVGDSVRFGTNREYGDLSFNLENDINVVARSQVQDDAHRLQSRYSEERTEFAPQAHDAFQPEANRARVEPIVDARMNEVLEPLTKRLERLVRQDTVSALGRFSLRGTRRTEHSQLLTKAEQKQALVSELETAAIALQRKWGTGLDSETNRLATELLSANGYEEVRNDNRQLVSSLLRELSNKLESGAFIMSITQNMLKRTAYTDMKQKFGGSEDLDADEDQVTPRPAYEADIDEKIARYVQQNFSETKIRNRFGRYYHPDRESGSEEAWKYAEKRLQQYFH